MIINFQDYKEVQEQKKSVILNVLVNYYKDLNDSKTVNIPYFLEARNTFNEIIKSNKDINFYYDKILKYSNKKCVKKGKGVK